MRIRKTIGRIHALSIGTLLVVLVVAVIVMSSVNAALTGFGKANALRMSLFERTIVRDEYLMDSSERARDTLRKKLADFADLLLSAGPAFEDPGDRELVANIGTVHASIDSIYGQIFGSEAAIPGTAAEAKLADESKRRLLSQLLLRSYLVNNELQRLEQNQVRKLERAVWNSFFLLGSGTLLAFLFVTASSVLGRRFISAGLDNLFRSARELGAGHLAFRLPFGSDDEIAEMAATMNRLAEELSDSLTSKSNLEAEMLQRRSAEREVKILNSELEERIRKRTIQLDAANQELEAFAYSVSHDLKAPLRSIQGFTSILAEDYAPVLDAEGRRLLGIVKGSASTLEDLITDLLALSRVGRVELVPVPIDMRALVEETWRELEPDGGSNAASLRLGELPTAGGDPTLIRQVWRNLLSNARKYCGKSEVRQIEVTALREAREIRYQVSDSGAGFDMAYVGKLFHIFQRLHAPSEFEGSGVGLAIVKRVVERHGGRVGAEGRVGEGARFWFSLPCEGAPEDDAKDPADGPARTNRAYGLTSEGDGNA